nr:hypothetical protein HK105_000190 [Polyrhizophydium stewartii]
MVPLGEKLSNFTDLEDGSVSALNASLHKESLKHHESSTITGAAEMPHIASDSGLNDHGEMAIPASADAVQVVYVQGIYQIESDIGSLYAGLCLLSLFVFPTPYNVASGVPNAAALDATQTIDTSRLSSYVPVGPTSFNVSATEIENLTMLLSPTFQFVAFYSTVAPGMAQLFPFGAVFACLAALQAVERMRAVRVPWLDEAAALVSFVANAVMYPIDSRLIQSQTDVYGGRYGKANWFLDPAKLSTEQLLEDLQTWKQCNCVRGVFGVICWILCVLAIDRQRMHSVLDGRLRPDGRGNAWSLAALGGRRKGSDANSRAIAPV